MVTSLPAEIKKTLTYDQGKGMSQHEQFTIDTGIQVFFAHPGSPWKRSTNENMNGLIHQHFPKGTNFADPTDEETRCVEMRLNTRPRKRLGFSSPYMVFFQNVNAALKT